MRAGDAVVLLSAPYDQGLGTVIGLTEIMWVEVQWANGELGAYPAQQLEQADVWERAQVERATTTG